MADKKVKLEVEEEPKGFSKTVKFTQPFDGEIDLGGKQRYTFKITRRDLYPDRHRLGQNAPKKPVEKVITNEAVYNWLIKFEAVSA